MNARNILLVGGGHAHVQVLASWKSNPLANVRLVLVCDRELTPYSGMLPGYLGGWYGFHDFHFDLPKMARAVGAEFVVDRAVRLDPSARTVHLSSGRSLKYDVASFDVGSRPTAIPWQGRGRPLSLKPISEFLNQWEELLERLKSWSSSTPARVAMVGGGASGFEVILMLAKKIRHLAPRPQLTLWQQGDLLAGHGLRARRLARAALDRNDVRLRAGVRVDGWRDGRLEFTSVDKHRDVTGGRGREVSGSEEVDVVLLATPATADPMFAASGLPCTEQGFLKTDGNLEVPGFTGLFGAGDCIAFPIPLPKSGVFAVRQGPILNWNLRAAVSGDKSRREYRPQRQSLALLTTGAPRVIASYGPWAMEGEWLWRIKDRIDRSFMAKFKSP